MFWQEDEEKASITLPDTVMDVSFSMSAKAIPIDHSWVLGRALMQVLPWLEDEPLARIHPIHVAESGNGWVRPEDTRAELLIPSKRTRLILRLPKTRLADADDLTGKTLSLNGYALTVGASKLKPLQPYPVVFARYVASSVDESEVQFMERMALEVRTLTGLKVKKMLCGKTYLLQRGTDTLLTRQLMIAELDLEASLQLQQYGLGGERLMGCGLVLPHKDIKSLST